MDQLTQYGKVITLVHFVHQTSPERIACMPGMEDLHKTDHHPSVQRSDDYRAVTCPACKRTEVFMRTSSGK